MAYHWMLSDVGEDEKKIPQAILPPDWWNLFLLLITASFLAPTGAQGVTLGVRLSNENLSTCLNLHLFGL